MKLVLDVETLALIPVGIALWFMMWVLWNWRKEERRKHRRSCADLPEIHIERSREHQLSRIDDYLRRSQEPVSSAAHLRFQRPVDLLTR
jgi:hypothetical protein